MADNCRSCGAEMIWAKTMRGRKMPVDAEPIREPPVTDQGVFVLLRTKDEPLALPLVGVTQLSVEAAESQGVPLFVSHFSTCPESDSWRK